MATATNMTIDPADLGMAAASDWQPSDKSALDLLSKQLS